MPSGGASGYAAIHSRVRVLYSTLISPQAGLGLREASDLAGLVTLLKNTGYEPYLKKLEDRQLTARGVVYQFKQRIADVYMTIIHSVPSQARPMATQFFRRFEIDNLKALLRGIASGASWEQIQDILFPMGSLGVLPARPMLEAGNIETAVALLAPTPYFDTLNDALKRYSEEQSLFPLEVALDLNYWQKLWNGMVQLPSGDRAQALRVIGPMVDMTNLLWAIRYRVYYHLSEEEVINYTLPIGYRVKDEDIRAIAAGADIARIVERIYPGVKDVDALLQEPEHGLPKLELQLQRQLRGQFHAIFTGYPFHIGLPLAFAVLNELEIQDLTVLVEAKAARMPTEAFLPYLLMETDLENIPVA